MIRHIIALAGITISLWAMYRLTVNKWAAYAEKVQKGEMQWPI